LSSCYRPCKQSRSGRFFYWGWNFPPLRRLPPPGVSRQKKKKKYEDISRGGGKKTEQSLKDKGTPPAQTRRKKATSDGNKATQRTEDALSTPKLEKTKEKKERVQGRALKGIKLKKTKRKAQEPKYKGQPPLLGQTSCKKNTPRPANWNTPLERMGFSQLRVWVMQKSCPAWHSILGAEGGGRVPAWAPVICNFGSVRDEEGGTELRASRCLVPTHTSARRPWKQGPPDSSYLGCRAKGASLSEKSKKKKKIGHSL